MLSYMAMSLLLVLYTTPTHGLYIRNEPCVQEDVATGLSIFNDECLPRKAADPRVAADPEAVDILGHDSATDASLISLQPIKGPPEGTSSNILLYMTTALSAQHQSFLECWPSKILANTSMLANADVIVQTYGKISPEVTSLLAAFPNPIVRLADLGHNPGIQEGAMKGVAEAFRNGWLKSYEWAIRLNPDVVIWSEAPLMKAMRSKGSWGVFANCAKKWRGRKRINTDFFAIRPSRFSNTTFSTYNGWNNAEDEATYEFKFVIDSSHDYYLQLFGSDCCRIHGEGIWHENEYCEDVFQRKPWATTGKPRKPTC